MSTTDIFRHDIIKIQLTESQVALAWETLGNPRRRRQYHRQLGLDNPPESEIDHQGQITDPDRTHSDDETIPDPALDEGTHLEKATSTNGPRVIPGPSFLLDDPFTTNTGPPRFQNHTRSNRPDTSVKSRNGSALPPMRTFRNPHYKTLIVSSSASNSTTDRMTWRYLPPPRTTQPGNDDSTRALRQTPPTPHYSERDPSTIPQWPTSAVREEPDTPNRVRAWITTSAKRTRDDGIHSRLEIVEDSRRWASKRQRRWTESPVRQHEV